MNVETNFKIPRVRSKKHMAFVATKPCLCCGWKRPEVHHLTCGPEPKARGLKAGDNWTVPLCSTCHRTLHAQGSERAFWSARDIDPIAVAAQLWAQSEEAGRA